MAAGLQAQWDATYGPTRFNEPLPQGQPWINAALFQQRVAMAMVLAATQIASEGVGVTQHTLRSQLATKVLNAPLTYMAAFAHALAALGLDQTSTDAQISTQIASVWNGFAGVP